jgi:hypothetical protein
LGGDDARRRAAAEQPGLPLWPRDLILAVGLVVVVVVGVGGSLWRERRSTCGPVVRALAAVLGPSRLAGLGWWREAEDRVV